MNISVPIANTMEYINNKEISPLISKGYCKVCYVGQEPNRNGTVITKEVATNMGRKLPGSPIVGYFNKEDKDFEGHNRELIIQDGKFEIVDVTRPYGFVPTDANVWFEKFSDEGVEHEYLCCDVYIWTGAYPESQRIMDAGNNQSMEITKDTGFWTNDDKTNARVFIYNEALIEKLCILGENVEPCFEGAQIGKQFSLEDDSEFKAAMFSMMTELQKTLNKGGVPQVFNEEESTVSVEEKVEDLVIAPAEVTEDAETYEKKPEDEEEEKKPEPEEGHEPPEPAPEEEPEEEKKKYNLEEVVEYAELKAQYEELENRYNLLVGEKENLDSEVANLKEFKLATERKDKQSMIDSFYMLADEDKEDVLKNIDTYSLDDIEAKLSIICVRNKVDFNLGKPQENPQGLFNLNNTIEDDGAPDWIKRVRETAKQQ